MGTHFKDTNQEIEDTQNQDKEVLRKPIGYLTWGREDSEALPIILKFLKHSPVEVETALFCVATRDKTQRRDN